MLTHGSLFTGVGLLDLGLVRAGLDAPVWVCELEPYRRAVLARRFPDAVQHHDVRAVGAGSAERVDMVGGGFPCKGASSAGLRNGLDHPETVLWREMRRAVGELEPAVVLIENVANILSLHRGAVWGEVLGDLAALGFDAEWDCLPAAAVGAPHLRDRVFAIATHPDRLAVVRDRRRRRARSTAQAPSADADRGDRGPRSGERPGSAGPEGWDGHGFGQGALASADADGGRRPELAERDERPAGGLASPFGHDAQRRGVPVEWGEYGPAIERAAALEGPAPEPLVRGVDDERTAWMERQRLSALGDGVHVRIGQLVGEHLMRLIA